MYKSHEAVKTIYENVTKLDYLGTRHVYDNKKAPQSPNWPARATETKEEVLAAYAPGTCKSRVEIRSSVEQ